MKGTDTWSKLITESRLSWEPVSTFGWWSSWSCYLKDL